MKDKEYDIIKNRIILQYNSKSQEANTYLTLSTITVIGFTAYLIVSGYFYEGAILGFVIFVFGLVRNKKAKKKMNILLRKFYGLRNKA